jgi:hypothetical protein
MKTDGAPHPVELLRDRHGVYGIGVSDLFDFEAVAWSCGIEPEPGTFEPPPCSVVLRPDRFSDAKSPWPYGAVLQKIAGGFHRRPFMHSSEEKLRRFIHHEALNRVGLRRPSQDSRWGEARRIGGRRTRSSRRATGASITASANNRFTSSCLSHVDAQ